MSERMIELQRARLFATGKGSASQVAQQQQQQNGSQHNRSLMGSTHGVAAAVPQTPQQAAVAAVRLEDLHMQRFLHRMQNRDDTRADSKSAPTVPTALSRRMLQRQGVGYFDSTVAAVVSAGADRFLATVLQQSVACRDQRLKGAGMAREASRRRKRHAHQYKSDADDRKRRKEEAELKREKSNLAAIEAAEALKKSGSSKEAKDTDSVTTKTKKKKKAATEEPQVNGKRKQIDGEEDDDDPYDSIDEEEEYYQNYFGDGDSEVEEIEEDDEALILRDVARPLEAWNFHVDGKPGMEVKPKEDVEDDDSIEDEMDEDDFASDAGSENGEGDTSTFDVSDAQSARNDAKSPTEDKGSLKSRNSSPAPSAASQKPSPNAN